jgi:hypothetical protein
MTSILNQIETALQKKQIINSFSVSENTIKIDADLEYISNINININNNEMSLITDITIHILSTDKRIKEEDIIIYPHEFKNKVELMGIIFSKITSYNRRIGKEIEALRAQLTLFGDYYE